MSRSVKLESRKSSRRIFRPNHEEPGAFCLDYILLPYGAFYRKTSGLLDAKTGDTLRFFNGPEYPIESVMLIKCDRLCDFLCRMRYGISWDAALKIWQRYAVMEGNGKDVLSTEECFLVIFKKDEQNSL